MFIFYKKKVRYFTSETTEHATLMSMQ
jgi:hypothetical protein